MRTTRRNDATPTKAGASRAKRPAVKKSPPAKQPRQKAPDKGKKRKVSSKREQSLARILQAAVSLFASEGYWNSSLEEVAAVAGFTKGAVYYHFKSKERLLLKVLETIEVRSIDATIAGVNQRGGSPLRKLEAFVKYQTQWAATYPEDLAVMIRTSVEISRAGPKLRAQMFRIYRKIGGFLETIIEAGKSTGEFSTRQNTRDIVLYLEAIHDGNMLLWNRSGNDLDIGRKLTRATLAGFAHAVRAS